MQKVPVADAVGMTLCHDITRIVPGREKCRAFKRGHVVRQEDIPLLLDLGKKHIFIWDSQENLVHEDEAAKRLSQSAAGPGLAMTEPNQGRVSLIAEYDGLFKVNPTHLNRINSLEGIIFSTLHHSRAVAKGTVVAATRVIPLAIDEALLGKAEDICHESQPLLSMQPFRPLKVGIITTGSEVFEGRIRDGFGPIISEKILPFGGALLRQEIVPDDQDAIAANIRRMVDDGAGLVLVTGGMSVDPDDVTSTGIRDTGAEVVFYGMPVLPGSMFMLAYYNDVPVCGLPGCVIFNRITSLDLLLPLLFAGERVNRSQIAGMGHGGLCVECPQCHYPECSFGKAF
ncbi:MAG: molybdopterin-binding protein [Bacillota bacterium]